MDSLHEIEGLAPPPKVVSRGRTKRVTKVLDEIARIFRGLRKSRILLSNKYVVHYEGGVISKVDLAKELGVDDGKVRVQKRPKGYISKLMNTPDDAIICFDEVPPTGWTEGYLFLAENGILDCLGDVSDIEGSLAERVKKILRLLLGKETTSKLFEDENVREALEKGDEISAIYNLDIDVYKYSKYDPYLGKKALESWEGFREELFKPYDPWLREIYEAYLAPYPHVRYAPHMILATNSGVGKSTLANAIGEEIDRTTVVGLVGGVIDKKVRAGLLHNKNYLVQVAQFESQDKEALSHLENLLANGYARRWVYAQKVETRFKGPLIFTTNIEATYDTQTPIVNVISKLSNPIAVGTRFLFMAHPKLVYVNRQLEFDVEAVHEALMSARALVRRKVEDIYRRKTVREWLDTPPPNWDDVEVTLRGTEWKNPTLKAYMHTVADEGYRKIKALALGRAISINLDNIYFDRVDPDKLIEIAEEYLGEYMKMLIDSANVINQSYEEDLDRLTINLYQNQKMRFVKYLLDALRDLIQRDLGALTSQEAEISINKLLEMVLAMAESGGKKWNMSLDQFIRRLKKARYKAYGGMTLGDMIGLEVDEDKGVVRILVQNLLHLHKEIEMRAMKLGLA